MTCPSDHMVRVIERTGKHCCHDAVSSVRRYGQPIKSKHTKDRKNKQTSNKTKSNKTKEANKK